MKLAICIVAGRAQCMWMSRLFSLVLRCTPGDSQAALGYRVGNFLLRCRREPEWEAWLGDDRSPELLSYSTGCARHLGRVLGNPPGYAGTGEWVMRESVPA